MCLKPDIIATVYFYPSTEGGRQGPTPSDELTSVLDFEGDCFDCRLLLHEVGPLWPGQEAVIGIKFLHWDLAKLKLKPGIRFYLREGKAIAEGAIEQVQVKAAENLSAE